MAGEIGVRAIGECPESETDAQRKTWRFRLESWIWRSRSRPSRPFPGSKWSCLLLRPVLQDALSEVTNICAPLTLRVLLDDFTAFMNGRNKEFVEMAEKVLRKLEREVEEKGLKLAITEGKGARQSLPASIWKKCFRNAATKKKLFWQRMWKRWEWTGERGPSSWERRRRREERRAMSDFRFLRRNGEFQKIYGNWSEEVVEDGFGSCDRTGRTSRWLRAFRNADIEEADGSSSRKGGVGFVISLHKFPLWPRLLGKMGGSGWGNGEKSS